MSAIVFRSLYDNSSSNGWRDGMLDWPLDQLHTSLLLLFSSMHTQSYRRSTGVHFHNIGLSGVNEMETTRGWKMLTLAGAMKYLGHEDVIDTLSQLCLWHDDVIKLKHFSRYWLFVRGIHQSQRPMTGSFDNYFVLCLNKRLDKQSRRQWFETPSCSLRRHCDGFRFG